MTVQPPVRWLLLAAFVLAILGGKLALIGYVDSDLPRADQWDAEGAVLVQPWLEHRLTLPMLAHPHNEHRPVTARLFTLGLFIANGRWDALVEMTAAAFVHTGFALVLLLLARRWLDGPGLVGFGALLVLLFALPFPWENTLNGFQVQFYFLLLFSCGHIVWSLEPRRFGWRWVLGQACGLAAVGSLASGSLSAAAVLAGVLLCRLAEGRWRATTLASSVGALALLALGWWMRNPVPGHARLAAEGPGEFLHYLLSGLTWPAPAWLPLVLMPAAWAVLRAARRRQPVPAEVLPFSLLIWVVLNAAALAYARGGDAGLPPRYLDLMAVNVALGFVFLALVPANRLWRVASGTWCALVLGGLLLASWHAWNGEVRHLPSQARQQESLVRGFLRTGDPAELRRHSWPEIPYPSADVLIRRLAPPVIRAVLPPSVDSPEAGRAPGRLRPMTNWLIQGSAWLAAAAFTALLIAGGCAFRQRMTKPTAQ